ncbi:MAG: fused MFS/spermidine synthase, partial [Candidatus Binatia bacterium]
MTALLHAAFFISGFTSLAFEVLWERELRLVFGVSTHSVAIVTSAFMGGLAVGYAIGRHPALARRPALRVYAVAEAFVAVYALLFPLWVAAISKVHVATGGSLVVRAVLAFLILFPPTIAMGITLPLVSRALAASSSAGRAAAGLFAANTTGGVIGTLVTSWYL